MELVVIRKHYFHSYLLCIYQFNDLFSIILHSISYSDNIIRSCNSITPCQLIRMGVMDIKKNTCFHYQLGNCVTFIISWAEYYINRKPLQFFFWKGTFWQHRESKFDNFWNFDTEKSLKSLEKIFEKSFKFFENSKLSRFAQIFLRIPFKKKTTLYYTYNIFS